MSTSLKIGILNLMPLKEVTEYDFLRLFSSSVVSVKIIWLRLRTHIPKHTSCEHMEAFYSYIEEIEGNCLDGLIITGAPVEQLNFEAVTYWPELAGIFDWAQTHTISTVYICWGAQAGLYYHYGVPKYPLATKKFGIFTQQIHLPFHPLFEGFGKSLDMPHSRHTEVREADIASVNGLQIAATSPESGVSIVIGKGGKEVFITGHIEYNRLTLDTEYRRDQAIGRTDVGLPLHYYPNDNSSELPAFTWKKDAVRLYQNWMTYLQKNTEK